MLFYLLHNLVTADDDDDDDRWRK